ncbi:hypothetical protein D6779_00590 [Candidatus Parcubacteria bacterium]|nr:MAG: hypothetical protein D6779_00590 [Candidatus Parcubacteria bacterium]
MMSLLKKTLMIVRKAMPAGFGPLATVSIIAMVCGLLRETSVAYYFGAGFELDMFLVAFTVPQFLVSQITIITVAVVLPRYVALMEQEGQVAAGALLAKWFWFETLFVFLFCFLCYMFAEDVISVLAPGLSAEQVLRAGSLMRWLLMFVFLLYATGCMKVVLETHGNFVIPAFQGPLISITVISSCFLFAGNTGVTALVIGFASGAAIAALLQFGAARKYEPSWPCVGYHRIVGARLPLSNAMWMVAVSMTGQMTVMVDRYFASSLPPGSISSLNYAEALIAVPVNVLAASLATTLFPVMSRKAANAQATEAYELLKRWMLRSVVAAGLLAVTIFLFRHDIVRIMFERGKFDEADVMTTAGVLGVLSMMLVASTVSSLLSKFLEACQLYRVIAMTGLAMFSVKLVFSFWLVHWYGIEGLALASVLAALLVILIRYVIARSFVGSLAIGRMNN